MLQRSVMDLKLFDYSMKLFDYSTVLFFVSRAEFIEVTVLWCVVDLKLADFQECFNWDELVEVLRLINEYTYISSLGLREISSNDL